MVNPAELAGFFLNCRGAREAGFGEFPERQIQGMGILNCGGQHAGIFERHGRTLGEIGQAGVGGIAHQHGAIFAPERGGDKIEGGPFGPICFQGKNIGERLAGALEGRG